MELVLRDVGCRFEVVWLMGWVGDLFWWAGVLICFAVVVA